MGILSLLQQTRLPGNARVMQADTSSPCCCSRSSLCRRYSMPVMLKLLLILNLLKRSLTLMWVNSLNIRHLVNTLTSNLRQFKVAASLLWSDEDSEDDAESDDGSSNTHDWTVSWGNLVDISILEREKSGWDSFTFPFTS